MIKYVIDKNVYIKGTGYRILKYDGKIDYFNIYECFSCFVGCCNLPDGATDNDKQSASYQEAKEICELLNFAVKVKNKVKTICHKKEIVK